MAISAPQGGVGGAGGTRNGQHFTGGGQPIGTTGGAGGRGGDTLFGSQPGGAGGAGGAGGLNGTTAADTQTVGDSAGSAGSVGQNGSFGYDGGGGGGGGAGGSGVYGAGAVTLTVTGTVVGAGGGAGGMGSRGQYLQAGFSGSNGQAGGGGDGVFLASGSVTLQSGSITGGAGGGAGAISGAGVVFGSGAATLSVAAGTTVTGGAGAGGGPGGFGVEGADLTVANAGAISGGLSGDGKHADAIDYAGGGGVLALGSAASFTGAIRVEAGVTLTFNQSVASSFSADAALSAAIVGDGAVTKAGSGVLTLSGASSFAGGTTISGGTLSVADVGALGTGAVTDYATLAFSGVSGTFANAVSGYGSITVTGVPSGSTLTFAGLLMQVGFAIGDTSNVTFAANKAGGSALRVGGGVFTNLAAFSTAFSDGILTAAGGVINNGDATHTGAYLFGYNSALNNGGGSAALTVNNYGTIQALAYEGITQRGSGALTVINYGTGFIYTQGNAESSAWAIGDDSGTASVNVTNMAGGRISAPGRGVLGNTAADKIANAGTINGAIGVELQAGGSVSNSGSIAGGQEGIKLGASATIVNTGAIQGTNDAAVSSNGAGSLVSVLNAQSANSSTGQLTGAYGVDADRGVLSLVNYGVISGTQFAIHSGGASVTAQLLAGSTTGDIQLSEADDSVTLYTGGLGLAAVVTTSPVDGSTVTLRNAGDYRAAQHGAIAVDAGSNSLILAGSGVGAAGAVGEAGALDLSQVTGSFSLTKQDAGLWTLTGAADAAFTGATTVQAGVLAVDASAYASAITVNSGGTLRGTGTTTAGVTVASGAAFAPGETTGTFTSATLSLSGTFAEAIASVTAFGQSHVTASSAGAVTLSGMLTLNYVGGAEAYGTVYRIIDNTGTAAVSGTFLGLAEGATLTSNDHTFMISYIGGTNNDVTLTDVTNTRPTIVGTMSGQTVSDMATVQPFSTVTVGDPDSGAIESVTITVTAGGVASDADGRLSGAGLTRTGTGTYTLTSDSPEAVTSALEMLVFTPTAGQVATGGMVTTGFTLSVSDGLVTSPTTDSTTTVVATAASNSLTVAAGNTTTISTVQTYTGKTLISGELDLLAGGSIASSSQVALKASGAVFDVSGAGAGGATVTIQELSGVAGSAIKLGSGVLSVNETATAAYTGVISGAGGLVVNGSAPLMLTGSDTYTGKTQISGELDLGAGGAIASSSQVALKASGAVFDVSGAGAGGATVVVQQLSGVTGSTIRLGAGVLSLTERVAATYAGVITDGGSAGGTGGSLVVNGTAPLTLTAGETYTGKTQIYGVLDLAGAGTLNHSKGVALKVSNATFDISGATGKEAILNLAGVAGSHVALGGNMLKINQSTLATYAGTIVDGGAAGGSGGGLIVKGTATLALTGANTFTGGVTLLSGTLELGAVTAAGVGHALTFAGAATLQLDAGALGGSGTSRTYGTAISGFAVSDHIDLASLAYVAGSTAAYDGATLTVTSGGGQVALTVTGVPAGNSFSVADDGHGHVLVGLVGAG